MISQALCVRTAVPINRTCIVFFCIFPVSSYFPFTVPLKAAGECAFSNFPGGFLPVIFQSFLNLPVRNCTAGLLQEYSEEIHSFLCSEPVDSA